MALPQPSVIKSGDRSPFSLGPTDFKMLSCKEKRTLVSKLDPLSEQYKQELTEQHNPITFYFPPKTVDVDRKQQCSECGETRKWKRMLEADLEYEREEIFVNKKHEVMEIVKIMALEGK